MKKYVRRAVVSLCLLGVVFVVGSWLAAYLLTRARQTSVGPPPSDFTYAIETVDFATRDQQTIAGWFIPVNTKANTIILLHGKAGTRKQMLPRARWLRELGYNVLLYDARACGESTGDQITFGYREKVDLVAAVHFLSERGYSNFACLGVSQGGATILFAAEEIPGLKCVICESVYDDMTNAVDRRVRHFTGVPGWCGACLMVPFAEHRLDLSINDVRPIDRIGKLACPVFVISGSEDDRAWPEDAQRLFDAAREPKELWMVDGAGHRDLFLQPGYQTKVADFLNRHFK